MQYRIEETPVINEERWRAWVEKGRRADRRMDRVAKVLAGVAMACLATALTFLFTSAK